MNLKDDYDVVILGGGLAGSTLARQLKLKIPDLKIAILERQKFPLPFAAHKVGESSVELAAYYFGETLQLKDYLCEHQLLKAGLRFFYPAGDNSDITRRSEFGLTILPPAPSYQLDRGSFETMLWEENAKLGIDAIEDCKVKDVALGKGIHSASGTINGDEFAFQTKWLIDATGRNNFLRRKLKLQKETKHKASAVWFRVDDMIAIDTWSTHSNWAGRVRMGLRRLSTNHFMGKGYWVWFIPLAGRRTSIGIVFDEQFHDLSEMNSLEKTLKWLEKNEPQCAKFIKKKQDKIMDFKFLKQYSYNSRQVFSKDRWALTGEAGVFTDPFYSPGSDFIGISNTLITDLVISDRNEESIGLKAKAFQDLYLGMYDGFMKIFENQYSIMGNGPLMTLKIGWDWAVYWGIYTLLFMHDKYTDMRYMRGCMDLIQNSRILNDRIQRLICLWNSKSDINIEKKFIPFKSISFLRHLVLGLNDRFNDEELTEKLNDNYKLLCCIAEEIIGIAGEELKQEVTWFAKFKSDENWSFDELNLKRDIDLLSMGAFSQTDIPAETFTEEMTELEKTLVSFTLKELKRYELRGEMP